LSALCCSLGFEVGDKSHGLIISLLWVVWGFLRVVVVGGFSWRLRRVTDKGFMAKK
jgi:apolipoprotein N-acyltransferase